MGPLVAVRRALWSAMATAEPPAAKRAPRIGDLLSVPLVVGWAGMKKMKPVVESLEHQGVVMGWIVGAVIFGPVCDVEMVVGPWKSDGPARAFRSRLPRPVLEEREKKDAHSLTPLPARPRT